MKTLYSKFKISAALDESKPHAAQPGDAESSEVRRFGESLRPLDQQLRDSRPHDEVPEELHASVMRAVRQAAHERTTEVEQQGVPWFRPAWLAAPALALLAVAAVWWVSQKQTPDQPMVAAVSVQPSIIGVTELLGASEHAVEKVAAVAMSPLSAEVELLKQDLQNAREFLLASLP